MEKCELVAYLKGRSEAASIPAKEKKARAAIYSAYIQNLI